MSGSRVARPLPIIETEECIPHIARFEKCTPTQSRLEVIEEEGEEHQPSQMDSDIDSCSESSSLSTTISSSSSPVSPASGDGESKNEIPKDVLEYVERIREAINAERDQTRGEKAVEPISKVNVCSNPPSRNRTVPLRVLAERTRVTLSKLADSRKKASTMLVVKPRTKARSEKLQSVKERRSVLIGSTKIGRVQYIHEDHKGRPISLSATCDSARDEEAGSPLEISCPLEEGDENRPFWKELTNTRPKYDLRTGTRLGGLSSLKDRFLDVVISVRRSPVGGIETVKTQTSESERKRRWSKIN